MRRIAINTGGGDAPGLNAVIRATVLAATKRGWEVVGIENGYAGLLPDAEGELVPLTPERVRGITHLGGTILGSTNRGNPLEWECPQADGSIERRDRSEEVLEAFHRHGLDALIAIGGDGSLHIAADLAEKGLPVVGIPKTIDNDVAATSLTFGFLTAVETATHAIDQLHSTAESHQRVFVVEVMGASTGWIALFSGLAGTADVILIPEIPYDIEVVCDKVAERERSGRHFSIICVAVRRAQDRAAKVRDATHSLRRERDQLALGVRQKAGVPVLDTDHLPATVGRGQDRGPDYRVQAGCISSAGVDGDASHVRASFGRSARDPALPPY